MGNSVLTISPPTALATTTNGDAVDVRDFHGVCKFVLSTSATGGADQTCTVKLQTSADGTTGWTDTGLEFAATDDEAAATLEIVTNIDNFDRYVRAVTTLDGDGATVSNCVLLVGRKHHEP